MKMGMFLSTDDLAALTGRKIKSKQIETLRRMGLPFHVNAAGKPVVPVSAIEGRKQPAAAAPVWHPPK